MFELKITDTTAKDLAMSILAFANTLTAQEAKPTKVNATIAMPTEAAKAVQEAPPWTDNTLAPAQDEPQPVLVQPALTPQGPAITPSALRELLGKVSDKCGSDALAKLLANFNVKQFSKIPVESYPDVQAAANARLEAQA